MAREQYRLLHGCIIPPYQVEVLDDVLEPDLYFYHKYELEQYLGVRWDPDNFGKVVMNDCGEEVIVYEY